MFGAGPTPSHAILLTLLIAFVCAGELHAQTSASPPFKVGTATRHLLPPEPFDWRGAGSHALSEALWYPADNSAEPKTQRFPPFPPSIFEAAPAAPNAKLAASPAKLPLILLSHGTGGTAQSIAWLATALASQGYIVAAIDHPGNTAMGTYTVQGFTLWWLRAKDLSAVLDDMLADPDFGPRIDRGRIGAAGFSLGGYTVIELAGGITDQSWFEACKADANKAGCKPPPEFPDLITKSRLLAASDPAYASALRNANASYRDPRVRAVFAIAPALGPAVSATSLATIAIPVAIVDAERDSITPVADNAKYYAAKIPQAQVTILPGDADHYVFLDDCTFVGRETMPPLCNDRPGVDRKAIHNTTIGIAVKFFAEHLR